MARLSGIQLLALTKLSDGRIRSAYTAHVSMTTLEALYKRGLLSKSAGLGSMAFPRTSIMWTITESGRLALEQSSRDGGGE